jgi:hypothetical protein
MEAAEEKKTTEQTKSAESQKCACFCHKMPGVFVVLIGVAILLRALSVLSTTAFWGTVGVLVILAGLQSMTRGVCKCCSAAA